MVETEIVALRRFEMPWLLVNLWQVDLCKESRTWPHNNLAYLVCHRGPYRIILQLPYGGWKDIRVRNSGPSIRTDGALRSLDVRYSDLSVPKMKLSRGV